MVAIYEQGLLEAGSGTDWDISTGSNALINTAAIVDYDTLGDTAYLGGEIYSDAILIQAEIVDAQHNPAAAPVNALERSIAEADGDIARLQSEMLAADAQIAKFNKQIVQAKDAAQQAALDEMQNVEAEFDAVREQKRQADSVLGRTTVKAPVSGTIVRSYYHTAGGVIESGKAIFEILPSGVPLIIEAQIPRMQIDEVHKDQIASVRLTAPNQRTTPMLEGRVYYVSADSIAEGTGPSSSEVYLARVSIPVAQLERVKGFVPTPACRRKSSSRPMSGHFSST